MQTSYIPKKFEIFTVFEFYGWYVHLNVCPNVQQRDKLEKY